MRMQPDLHALIEREAGTLQNLTFVTATSDSTNSSELDALKHGEESSFAGHQSMEERSKSFEIAREMRVHCG